MMTSLLVILAIIVGPTYLAGRVAEVRGRSVRGWQWIAALVLGPFALPLLYLLPAARAR
jgi:hypothetical protein